MTRLMTERIKSVYIGWLFIFVSFWLIFWPAIANAETKWKETVIVPVWCVNISVLDSIYDLATAGEVDAANALAIRAHQMGFCQRALGGARFHPEAVEREWQDFAGDPAVVVSGTIDDIEGKVFLVVPLEHLGEFKESKTKILYQYS